MFTKYEKKMNCSPGLPRTFVTKRSKKKTPNSYHNDVNFFFRKDICRGSSSFNLFVLASKQLLFKNILLQSEHVQGGTA